MGVSGFQWSNLGTNVYDYLGYGATDSDVAAAAEIVQAEPLNFKLGGYIRSSAGVNGIGVHGDYWSAVRLSGGTAYAFYLEPPAKFSPSENGSGTYAARSVRCLAR